MNKFEHLILIEILWKSSRYSNNICDNYGSRSITAKWRGFEKLACIRQYRVTVCKEGNECPETVNMERDDAMLLTQFTSSVSLGKLQILF